METYGLITGRGFIVPARFIHQIFKNDVRALLAKLTVRHQPKIGAPIIVRVYKEELVKNTRCFILPRSTARALGPLLGSITVTVPKPVPWPKLELQIDLYRNQQVVIDHLMTNIFTSENMTKGLATGVLNLRAGAGKTFVAAALTARLGVKTLFITVKRSLRDQALKDFEQCFGPDAPIAAYSKKNPPRDDAALVVIVINTAMKLGADFFARFSLIILDEIHELCSPVRRELFWNLAAPYVLGMSATTEELFNEVFRAHLGPIIYAEKIEGFTYDDAVYDCRARIIKYNGPPEYTKNLIHPSTGRMFTPYMYRQFLDDPYRLSLVVDELIALYDWVGPEGQKHGIFVFAEEIALLEHAKESFEQELRRRRRADIAEAIEIEIEAEMYTGGLSAKRAADIIARARILFTTYGYSGTGTSIVKMTAMIFLTPRVAKMPQVLGRIQRRGSDLTIPRIAVDIVDNRTGLSGQLRIRRQGYEYYKFKQEVIRADYQKINIVEDHNKSPQE